MTINLIGPKYHPKNSLFRVKKQQSLGLKTLDQNQEKNKKMIVASSVKFCVHICYNLYNFQLLVLALHTRGHPSKLLCIHYIHKYDLIMTMKILLLKENTD